MADETGRKTQVLFLTDRGEWHQRAARAAAPPGIEVLMRRRPSAEALAALLPNIEVVISERSQPVREGILAAAPHLRLIVRLGSLYHDIAVEAARAQGVRVSVQPDSGCIYGAEHLLMMTLAVLKRLKRSLRTAAAADHGRVAHRTDEDTFAFNWLGFRDLHSLFGKTVAILGMGEMGVEMARRLAPFRPAAVLYHKRHRYPPEVETDLSVTYASWADCLEHADILVSLLPYSSATDGILNAAAFAQMQPTAVLIHAGSGSVIDEPALAEALQAGRLRGAAVDTFEYEPLPPDSPLIPLARDPDVNLLLTPHTAVVAEPDAYQGDFDEVTRFLAGEPLRFAVA
jgi:phosphoglycerate dehydrogenase-like enzyme